MGMGRLIVNETILNVLNSTDAHFLTQKTLQPTLGNSIVDLILTDEEELITELKINGNLA